MIQLQYWKECLEDSFEEHKISATPEQIKGIASDIQASYENIGLVYPTPENPLISELLRVKQKLKKEMEKVVCKSCNGTGSITTYGGTLSATSPCWKCNGEGYL